MKLDAKFYGVIVKAKDGTIVPPDEYVVFLAKDSAFAAVLPKYLDECQRLGCDGEQINQHKHEPKHVSRFDGGRYECCDCGATRRVENGKHPEPWHTCELCTHPWGRP